MDLEFWAQRWKEGRIGFHEGRTNAFLERHVGRLGPAGRHVLVPLCGKTEDLAFLAGQGHRVTGIEAVQEAAQAFFREHAVTPEVGERGEHIRSYTAGRITILVGDFFACSPALVGDVDALYDRAALVALSATDRTRYVASLRTMLPAGARGLLVNVEYDTSKMDPPPHCVTEDEVRRLWSGAQVTELEAGLFQNKNMRQSGVVATERCFAVEL